MGVEFLGYSSFPSSLLASWWMFLRCFPTSKFDEKKSAVSLNILFLCDSPFFFWMFVSFVWKFNNYQVMHQCFLIFIIYPKLSKHILSVYLFFYFEDFPQLNCWVFSLFQKNFFLLLQAHQSFIYWLLLFLYQCGQLPSNCFISPSFSLCDLLQFFFICSIDLAVIDI